MYACTDPTSNGRSLPSCSIDLRLELLGGFTTPVFTLFNFVEREKVPFTKENRDRKQRERQRDRDRERERERQLPRDRDRETGAKRETEKKNREKAKHRARHSGYTGYPAFFTSGFRFRFPDIRLARLKTEDK